MTRKFFGTKFAVVECLASGNEHIAIVSKFTVQTITTGSPTTAAIAIDGSIDNGTSWGELATDGTTAGAMFHFVDKLVTHIRASVTTLSGGASPTVEFKIVGAL